MTRRPGETFEEVLRDDLLEPFDSLKEILAGVEAVAAARPDYTRMELHMLKGSLKDMERIAAMYKIEDDAVLRYLASKFLTLGMILGAKGIRIETMDAKIANRRRRDGRRARILAFSKEHPGLTKDALAKQLAGKPAGDYLKTRAIINLIDGMLADGVDLSLKTTIRREKSAAS